MFLFVTPTCTYATPTTAFAHTHSNTDRILLFCSLVSSHFRMEYKIVEFKKSVTVDWIPQSWVIGLSECQYPKLRNDIIAKLKKNFAEPEAHWPTYDIRIMGSALTIEEARKLTVTAEYTSDLALSDVPRKRTIHPPKFYVESYESPEKRIKKCQKSQGDLPPYPDLNLPNDVMDDELRNSEPQESTSSQISVEVS